MATNRAASCASTRDTGRSLRDRPLLEGSSDYNKGYVRGAKQAAGIAMNYKTTHANRLDDCILGKLNIGRTKPRRNKDKVPDPADQFAAGCAFALAEVMRIHGDSVTVKEAARAINLTIDEARRVGLEHYDLKELKKAGLPKS